MTPPTSVTVGPHHYKVSYSVKAVAKASMDNGERLVGRCDTERLRIVVDPRLAPTQQAETLVHEVLHAAMSLIGADEDISADVEERLVRRLAPVLVDVAVRNPKLVGWVVDP